MSKEKTKRRKSFDIHGKVPVAGESTYVDESALDTSTGLGPTASQVEAFEPRPAPMGCWAKFLAIFEDPVPRRKGYEAVPSASATTAGN